MKWNLIRAIIASSIIMMIAWGFLAWNLHINNYLDAGHVLMIFGWMILFVTCSFMKKEILEKPLEE